MATQKEDDFGVLIQSHINGGGSFYKVLEHDKFQKRLRSIAHGRDFTVFHGDRGPNDLCQDVSLKLLESDMNSKLQIPGNILTEEEFFIWLFVVVRNFHLGTIRQRLALKRERLRSDKPLEDYDYLMASESKDDREEILRRFPEFIKRYPVKRQLVVRLWLKDKPYRRIQKVLERLRFKVSHVTVGNWINATIEDFREDLDSPPHMRTGT
jgi:hypothetical protein